MKRTIGLLLTTTIILSLCACGINKTSSEISHTNFSVAESSIPSAIKQEVESESSTTSNSTYIDSFELKVKRQVDVYLNHIKKYRAAMINGTAVLPWEDSSSWSEKSLLIRGGEGALPFYKWTTTQEKILFPKPTKDFELTYMSDISNEVGYLVSIYSSENTEYKYFKHASIYFYPIENNVNLDENLLTLIKDRVDKNTNLSKSETECKWGEYYVDKTSPTAYFRYDDYVIKVDLPYLEDGAPFDPEYFNYFDFEYVSLEN